MTKQLVSILIFAGLVGAAGSAFAAGTGCLKQNTASAGTTPVPHETSTKPAGQAG
jgi:hypothetical protein